MRYPSLLCWLTFVLVSISAADICGIPKIKPYFCPTLNDTELESILGGDAAVPHSFPWMARLLQSLLLHRLPIVLHTYIVVHSYIVLHTYIVVHTYNTYNIVTHFNINSIHLNDVFFCAGTIIGKKWILTAAHWLVV